MDNIYRIGIEIIVFIQQIHGPVLDSFFRGITSLGSAITYVLVLPFFFWCVDTSLGSHAGILFLSTSYVANGLKDVFQQPRPFQIDPSVKLANADGYGLPSFHAMEATIMWGMFALWYKKKWFWIVAISAIAMIGFSRIYLGVHFPTDVLAGYVIGALALWLYVSGGPVFERWLKSLEFKWQIVLAITLPAVLAIGHPTADVILIMSVLSGFSVGLALMNRYLSFSAEGPIWQRVARFLAGDAIIGILYFTPQLFAASSLAASMHLAAASRLLHYLNFAVIGLWITFGGPWLFLKIGLASEIKETANAG